MNVFIWVLQILLGVHTLMGAVWKVFNPVQTVPSLNAIPHGVWLAMGVLELLCGLALIIPFNKPLSRLAPIAALFVVAEMLLFSGLHLSSGDPTYGPVIYWMVVAVFSAFVAYARFVLRPR